MSLPENIQQPFIRKLGRVEIDLDRFAVISEIMVSGVLLGSSRISNSRSNYTFDGPKLGIRAPESPQGEGGGLRSARGGHIDGRPGGSGEARITHGAAGFHLLLLGLIFPARKITGFHDRSAGQTSQAQRFHKSSPTQRKPLPILL